MSVTRKPPRGNTRLRLNREEEEVLVPVGADASVPAGVAELVRRLTEAESKLQTAERDRAGEAELIGNLLAEIGERDRHLRALEERVEAEDTFFADLLQQLSARYGNAVPLPSELHDLLAVTLAALDVTRSTTSAVNTSVEEISVAIRGGPDVERGLGATLARGQSAEAAIAPADRAIGRVIDGLREVERRERELSELRAELLADATSLIADLRRLGEAVGRTVGPAVRPRPPQRRRSPSTKLRR